jgi:hypothetical protein
MNQTTHPIDYSETQEMEEHFHPHLSLLLLNNDNHIMETASPAIPETASIKLWKTGISKRAVNVCKLHDWMGREAIKKGNLSKEDFKPLATVNDLSKWTKEELSGLQNCGKRTVKEFEELLNKYGLSLKV